MPIKWVEPENKFLVGCNGKRVLIQNMPIGPISKEDAMLLAAWLVAVADPSPDHDDFNAVLMQIEQD